MKSLCLLALAGLLLSTGCATRTLPRQPLVTLPGEPPTGLIPDGRRTFAPAPETASHAQPLRLCRAVPPDGVTPDMLAALRALPTAADDMKTLELGAQAWNREFSHRETHLDGQETDWLRGEDITLGLQYTKLEQQLIRKELNLLAAKDILPPELDDEARRALPDYCLLEMDWLGTCRQLSELIATIRKKHAESLENANETQGME